MTMAEYIDREKVGKAFSNIVRYSNNSDLAPVPTWNLAVDIVLGIPTEDVKPVVHGEWIKFPECLKYPNAYSEDHVVCSACKECFSVLYDDTGRFVNFCPNCGADMR